MGHQHSYFLQLDGRVWACGSNDRGQLGLGNDDEMHIEPVLLPIEAVQRITAGDDHTFFLKTDGSVWACGYNSNGQLGLGHKNYSQIELQPLPKYSILSNRISQLQEKETAFKFSLLSP